MKIRAYSDLHLDHYLEGGILRDEAGDVIVWRPPALSDDSETTLILAGDLWEGTKIIEYMGYSWLEEIAPRFKEVILVLGNHDYYDCQPEYVLTIEAGAIKIRKELQKKNLTNVKILDCDTYDNGEVLFVGATLWTDLNKADPLVMFDMLQTMKYDKDIHFEHIDGKQIGFSANKWLDTHSKHKNYIEIIAKQNRNRDIVVVTHHVPLSILSDPRFAGDASNAFYNSDLSDLILDNENIKLWVYGHTHYCCDVMFGACRMLNNSVGYKSRSNEFHSTLAHKSIPI